jgi:hypothetical protein
MTKKPTIKPAPTVSWSALAKALGVHRQSLVRWRSLPDAPTAPDIEAWQDFIASKGLGRGGGDELAALRAELLREQIERERRRNQAEARALIPIEECCAAARKATAAWASVLWLKLEQESPARLVGKDIAEIRAEISKIHDELVEAYAAEFTKASVENPPPLNA